jgi:hypothetical protein
VALLQTRQYTQVVLQASWTMATKFWNVCSDRYDPSPVWCGVTMMSCLKLTLFHFARTFQPIWQRKIRTRESWSYGDDFDLFERYHGTPDHRFSIWLKDGETSYWRIPL